MHAGGADVGCVCVCGWGGFPEGVVLAREPGGELGGKSGGGGGGGGVGRGYNRRAAAAAVKAVSVNVAAAALPATEAVAADTVAA